MKLTKAPKYYYGYLVSQCPTAFIGDKYVHRDPNKKVPVLVHKKRTIEKPTTVMLADGQGVMVLA